MFWNYLKIAVRNLLRHKSYTLINLFGLTIGMACCILIALYAREELSFDTFHAQADRIVAIGTETSYFGRSLSTPFPLADAMVNELPEVTEATRTSTAGKWQVSRDGETFIELKEPLYTEPTFFDVFSFHLLRGNRATALTAPNSIVLTRQTSERLFGADDPLGKSITYPQEDTALNLQVTGVVEDVPRNSSIQFDALISMTTQEKFIDRSWSSFNYYTYALLHSSEDLNTLPAKLASLAKTHSETRRQPPSFFMLPLSKLHLSESTQSAGFTGNRAYLYLFGSIALFILLIACVNYINLATARMSIRWNEVGVRKTIGARRGQVAGQFLSESVVLSLGAYLLGIPVAEIALPFFNQLFGTSLAMQPQGFFLIWLGVAAVVVGMLAGLYPAVYLSRFPPTLVLRNHRIPGSAGTLPRKSLVVFQFALALILIIGAMVVLQQLRYTQNTDLGFDGEQVVAVKLFNRSVWDMRKELRTALAGYTGIRDVSIGSSSPGRFPYQFGAKPQWWSPQAKTASEQTIRFAQTIVDEHFLPLLHIHLVAGRNFMPERRSDRDQAYIINTKAVEVLGWTPEEAVGKPFHGGTVIGVTDNFHIQSLHKAVEPISLQLNGSYMGCSILARLAPDHIPASLNFIKEELHKIAPASSFDYEFLDEKFDAMYRTDRRFGHIIDIFTVIAMVIAYLGLYGLAAFSAERRVKEIGIRKVVGASVQEIVLLLTRDFTKWVLLANVIAWPVAYYAVTRWLQNFAYRIDLTLVPFLLSGLMALLIALLTISWQSVRSALANPVEALRYE